MMRTYSELIKIPTFAGRFEYLKLGGAFGEETFGSERYLNQSFYHSHEWKTIRKQVIVRDMGCDLACEGMEVPGVIVIHHMNPISIDDILHSTDLLFNPEYLITTSKRTHNAIHFADDSILCVPVERKPNDTCPWKGASIG